MLLNTDFSRLKMKSQKVVLRNRGSLILKIRVFWRED